MAQCVTFHSFFFFFNDTATTEIYTLSLHDALPISFSRFAARDSACGSNCCCCSAWTLRASAAPTISPRRVASDRKSTRLNSSHLVISYAVFCLKKKKKSTDNSESYKREL